MRLVRISLCFFCPFKLFFFFDIVVVDVVVVSWVFAGRCK